MPAFTLAELKEQIDEVRAALKDAQKQQASVSGGAGGGLHTQRGNVREMQERLKWLCQEYDRLEALAQGGTVNHVQFGRER